jgi:hypothetical protein
MQSNINESIWVKLTKDGKKVHKDYYGKLCKLSNGTMKIENYKPKINPAGYAEYQMWELMHIFGPVLYNGSTVSPFEKNILYYSM